jgi:hypothetical protein
MAQGNRMKRIEEAIQRYFESQAEQKKAIRQNGNY